MILEPRTLVPGYPYNVPSFFQVNGPGGPIAATLNKYPADQIVRGLRAWGSQAWVSPVIAATGGTMWPSWATAGIGATLPTGKSFFWGWANGSELARYIAGTLADRVSYLGTRIRLDSFARAMNFYQ